MPFNPLLGPVVVLVAWSLVVLIWLAVVRFGAFKTLKIDPGRTVGARGQDLDGKVEPTLQWPSHNYTHLMEQPTIFYAIVLALVLMGDKSQFNLTLAWAYVAIRVVHSIWQITINQVPVRFALFLASTLCLAGLTFRGLSDVIHSL